DWSSDVCSSDLLTVITNPPSMPFFSLSHGTLGLEECQQVCIELVLVSLGQAIGCACIAAASSPAGVAVPPPPALPWIVRWRSPAWPNAPRVCLRARARSLRVHI